MSKKRERVSRLAKIHQILADTPVNCEGKCEYHLDEVNDLLAEIKTILALDGVFYLNVNKAP